MKIITSAICECGCGAEIPRKRHHRYRLPRFIAGHNSKSGQNGIRGRRRHEPPEDIKPFLTGICGCGCGGETTISTNSRRKFDAYFGWPQRFIHGHHARLLSAERTSAWRGGRIIDGNGYVRLYKPTNAMSSAQGYVLEHRFVMSEMIGRPLTRDEHVHHKNGNRQDNRRENLELILQRHHTPGQRAEDLVMWAREIEAKYGHLFPAT